jgi:hypothetical protein
MREMQELQELPAQASKKNSSVKWKSTKKNRVLKLAGEVDSNNLSGEFPFQVEAYDKTSP